MKKLLKEKGLTNTEWHRAPSNTFMFCDMNNLLAVWVLKGFLWLEEPVYYPMCEGNKNLKQKTQ